MRAALIAALLFALPAASSPTIQVYSAASRANPASCGASCPSAHLAPLSTFPAEYWERNMATATITTGGNPGWIFYADGSSIWVIVCEHCSVQRVLARYAGPRQGDLFRLAGNTATDRMRTWGDPTAGLSTYSLRGDYLIRYEPFTSVNACDEGGAGDDPSCCTDYYEGNTGDPNCAATTAPAPAPTYAVPPLAIDWNIWNQAMPADGLLLIGMGMGAVHTRSDFRWIAECNANPDRRPQGSGTGVDACCTQQWNGPDANESRPSSMDPATNQAAWGGRGVACGGGLTNLGAENNSTLEAGAGYNPAPGSLIPTSLYSWAAAYVIGTVVSPAIPSTSLPKSLLYTPVPPGKTVKQVLPWRTTVSPGVFEWHAPTAPVEMTWLPFLGGQSAYFGSDLDPDVRPSGIAAQVHACCDASSGDSGGPKFVYNFGRWWFAGANSGPLQANSRWWYEGTRWEIYRLLPASARSSAPGLNLSAP